MDQKPHEIYLVEEPHQLVEDCHKTVWLDAPTKLLLALLEEYQGNVGKSFELSTKKKMWKSISMELKAAGYKFSDLQVQGKYRSLERQYKKTKLHNSKTGWDRVTCVYQVEIDKVFGKKRGVFPEYTLDYEEIQGLSREEMVETAEMSSVATINNSPPSTSSQASNIDSSSSQPKKKKYGKSIQEKTLEKIEDLTREKAVFHKKVLDMLEKKK